MNAARNLVVLAAGGTGGHVFPAQALAEELLSRGRELALVTDRRGAAYGGTLGRIETHRISAARIGGGVVGVSRGIFALGRGYIQARAILRRLTPAAVVGFGGYPSVPTVVAARGGRTPTMIHEQNAVLGRANRLLAPRVARIATSFAAVAGVAPTETAKLIHTGNPVRAAVAACGERGYAPPEADGTVRLLVTGGSQGASVMSAIVPAAVERLPAALRRRLVVVQQCRAEDLEAVRARYASCGVAAELARFFDDIPARLGDAHLVIARAGASTVAELSAAGRPAILVPYPHATDDHQTANAQALATAGGAWHIAEPAFTADALAERLLALLDAPQALAKAARAALGIGRPDAAARLADAVDALIPSRGNGSAGGTREAAA